MYKAVIYILMLCELNCKSNFAFQAFRIYDVDENETVTKGEFRRVLETYCMPLTSEQFDSIVAKVGNF